MAVLPADIPTGLVTGQFYFVNEDNVDAGTDPDLTVVSGFVTFTCSAKRLRMPSKLATVIPLEFKGVFDSQGRLVSATDPSVGLELPATNSSLFNPTGFTWTATFDLVQVDNRHTVVIDPFSFQVPEGVTTDLTLVMPVDSTPGTITIQGPQGNASTVPGPPGVGVPTGGTALQYIRKNAGNTDTEWATLNAATGSVAGTMSAADKTKLDSTSSVETPTSVVMRDSSGNSQFGTVVLNDAPAGVNHATRKDYVDAALALKLDTSANLVTYLGNNTKLDTDAPSTYPLGVSYMSTTDNGFNINYGTVMTVRTGITSRTFQLVFLSVSGAMSIRAASSDTWGAFWKPAPDTVSTAGVTGLMPGTDKTKLDAATSNNTASTLVQRNSGGDISVRRVAVTDQPTTADQATRKDYVDGVVATKAALSHTHPMTDLTGTLTPAQLPAATGSAAGSMSAADKTKLDAATALTTASTLVVRDSSGLFAVTTPTAGGHPTTKTYVDGKVWDGSAITTGTVPAARLPVSTGSVPGTMSAADKAKLDAASVTTSNDTLVSRSPSGNIYGNTLYIDGVQSATANSATRRDYVDGAVLATAQGGIAFSSSATLTAALNTTETMVLEVTGVQMTPGPELPHYHWA